MPRCISVQNYSVLSYDTHVSSLQLLVYFLKLLRHISYSIYSYILFGAPSLLPPAFGTYPKRNILIHPLWSSLPTSLSKEEYTHTSSVELLTYFLELEDMSNKIYAHTSSLELQVCIFKLLRHIY